MVYHTADELYSLGQEVYNKAIGVLVKQGRAKWAIQAMKNGDQGTAPTGYITEQVDGYAHREWADIPALLSSFGTSDPAECQPAVDALNSAAAALDPDSALKAHQGGPGKSPYVASNPTWLPDVTVGERVGALQTHLQNWDGNAAEAFQTNFLVTLTADPSAATLQATLASSLAFLLQARQSVLQRANDNVWSIGTNTLSALDAIGQSCSPTDFVVSLTLFSAIAAVVSGGELLPVLASIIGLVTAGIGVATDPSVTIGGGSVPAVMSAMRNALVRVIIGVNGQEDQVVQCLNTISGNLDRPFFVSQIEIPAPTEITALNGVGLNRLKNDGIDNPYSFFPRS